jgi:hypothetical protein
MGVHWGILDNFEMGSPFAGLCEHAAKQINSMTIEFHNPDKEVAEWVIDFVRDKLMEFHARDKEISRAEVYFHKQPMAADGEYVCRINITIYGNSFFVRRNKQGYLEAAREVIAELSDLVDQQIKDQKEPPDSITSSVKV